MRPTTAFNDNVFDIKALLHPGTVFNHPRGVLARPSHSNSEKRATLRLGVRRFGDRFLPHAAGAGRSQGAGYGR
jgi:hypothetical protein